MSSTQTGSSSYVDAEDNDQDSFCMIGQDLENMNMPVVNGEDSESSIEAVPDPNYSEEEVDVETVDWQDDAQLPGSNSDNEDLEASVNSNLANDDDGTLRQMEHSTSNTSTSSGDNEFLMSLNHDQVANLVELENVDQVTNMVEQETENLKLVKREQGMLQNMLTTLTNAVNNRNASMPAVPPEPSTSRGGSLRSFVQVGPSVPLNEPPLSLPTPPASPPVARAPIAPDNEFTTTSSSDDADSRDDSSVGASLNKRKRKSRNLREQLKALQNHYLSSDRHGRIIIFTFLIASLTSFFFLSIYSAQTHNQDMEIFKLKEKETLNQQSIYERMQERYENFRETLVHQRYEETRECRDTLKTCHSGKEGFLNKIAKLEEDASTEISELRGKLDLQKEEIFRLRGRIQEVQRDNKELIDANMRLSAELREMSQQNTQVLSLISDLLKNKGVQILLAGVVIIAAIPIIFSSNTKV